jgi:hypothetical protein
MKTHFKTIISAAVSAAIIISSFSVFAENGDISAAIDNRYIDVGTDTTIEIPDDTALGNTNNNTSDNSFTEEVTETESELLPELTDTFQLPDMTMWDDVTTLDWNEEFISPVELNADNIASGKCGANLTWTLNSEGTLIISGTGNMNNYGINSNGITSAPWGQYADRLKRLLFSNEMTSIGECAFTGCSNLTGDLIIPDNITNIGKSAFMRCSGFNGGIIISNSITSINGSTFSGCLNLSGTLVIPDGVTSIGSSAFSNCSNLTGRLIIPDGVTSIGNHAFENCSGFTGNITIPANITSIGNRMFYNCSNLTGDIIIPDGVTSIGEAAFYRCSGLNGILVIPDSVTSIGSSAFDNCRGLTDMYILQAEDNISTGHFRNKIHWKYDLSICKTSIRNQICTGEAIIPDENSITVISPNGKTLHYGTDYVIESARNNVNVGTAIAHIAPPNNGISVLSQDVSFNIIGIDLSDAIITFPDDISYQGEACTPEPTVVVNGKTLTKDIDYTVLYSNNNGVGTAAAIITGTGNYTGIKTVEFEIGPFKPQVGREPVALYDDTIEGYVEGSYIYDGSAKEPKPIFIYHFVNPTTDIALDYNMIEGVDYEIISYKNNLNAGIGRITVKGLGSFKDETTVVFAISPCELSDTEIADIPSEEYCKEDICPEPEIRIGDKVLEKDIDYTLEYENNRNRGTASVVITGKGNLTGTITKNFEITPRDGTRFTIIVWL